MKNGLLFTRGFVSSFALIVLIYVFSFGYVHFKIISNLLIMQKKAQQLEIKTYLEVILVRRIKNQYLNNEVFETETLSYQMYDVTIKYTSNTAHIEFDDSNEISIVEYEYDESTENLIRK